MRIEDVMAYEVVKEEKIEEVNSRAMILKHKKTGARIALMENEDENKVFYIGFRTPPKESTGVMHILEHSVLCGSKKFPLKDPFIELAKGSLNTFLNAMTYPDKTVYPVASCNDKDFQNLMDVYLDAVFYPNIYQNDMTFKQEGWHYELEKKEDPITINGVVYNEMKGAFSAPDDVLEREIFNSLFPDTSYSEESGGDPKRIPELTYEHFLEIHGKYYHPSNCYIYLYGNMDMAEKLNFIDKEYLSNFEAITVDSEIPTQKSFAETVHVHKEFSITDSEPEKENTYLSYNCVTGDNMDRMKYIGFQVLDYALCGAPGAVLKQALLDKGIGKDIYSFYDNGIKQPYFSVVAKNADAEKKEDFIQCIEETLNTLVKEGIDRDTLRAGLNYFEFKYREADFGSYPPGLMYGLQMFDSWLYDDNRPFIHIRANDTFKALREGLEKGYFEELLKECILENSHKSVVMITPKKNLADKDEKELAERLADYKASLSEEELQRLVEETEALRIYQETEDTPEQLACIPVLERSDIKKETAEIYNDEREIAGRTSLYHPIFTNGINYFRLMFNVKEIPKEYFPYIGVLKGILGVVDTKNYTYRELFNRIHMETGGMVPVINLYTNSRNLEECTISFEWKVKTLKGKIPEAFSLLKEIIFYSAFTDEKRLYEIIAELKSRMQANIMSAGHQVAAGRACAYFSKAAVLQEVISGLPCYKLVEALEKDFEGQKEKFVEALKGLCTYLFTKENVMFDFTGDEAEYAVFQSKAEELMKELPSSNGCIDPFTVSLGKKNEGLCNASMVQYVCRAGNFRQEGLDYTGALKVLRVIMGYDYLWNNVRVKGGAYGCMSSFGKSGDSYFVSYRDPNLKKTVDVFEKAAEYVENFSPDERSMTQYIIGAISELDTPQQPAAKALRSLSAYMTKQTKEDFQKERDELLAADKEAIQGLAKYIRAFMKDDYLCVVGNEEKIKEEAGLFHQVENMFQ